MIKRLFVLANSLFSMSKLWDKFPKKQTGHFNERSEEKSPGKQGAVLFAYE